MGKGTSDRQDLETGLTMVRGDRFPSCWSSHPSIKCRLVSLQGVFKATAGICPGAVGHTFRISRISIIFNFFFY